MTSLATIIGRGATGSKPAAGTPGALYYDTTLGQLQRDNGSSWDAIEAGGELSGTDLSLTGLTGSTSTFRFVGANASGAPASGAHSTNDVALDIAGKQWYLCTAGGTPGTWATMGGGGGGSGPAGRLGYAQITASASTTSTSFVDVSGLSVTVTCGTRSVKITVFAERMYGTVDQQRMQANIVDVTAGAQLSASIVSEVGAGNTGSNVCMMAVHTPGAGSRTYKVQILTIDAGTANLAAGTTFPAFILVEEI